MQGTEVAQQPAYLWRMTLMKKRREFPQVTEALLESRERMRVAGHGTGALKDDAGRLCMLGALPDDCNLGAARDAVKAALGVEALSHWNDAPGRTLYECLDAFDAAASLSLDGSSVEDLP